MLCRGATTGAAISAACATTSAAASAACAASSSTATTSAATTCTATTSAATTFTASSRKVRDGEQRISRAPRCRAECAAHSKTEAKQKE